MTTTTPLRETEPYKGLLSQITTLTTSEKKTLVGFINEMVENEEKKTGEKATEVESKTDGNEVLREWFRDPAIIYKCQYCGDEAECDCDYYYDDGCECDDDDYEYYDDDDEEEDGEEEEEEEDDTDDEEQSLTLPVPARTTSLVVKYSFQTSTSTKTVHTN